MDSDDSNFQAPPSKRVRTTKPGGGTKRRERQSKKVVSDGASPRLTRSQSRLRRRVENDIERESQRSQALRIRDSNKSKQETIEKPTTSSDRLIHRSDNSVTNSLPPSHTTLITPSTQSTNVSSTVSLSSHTHQSRDPISIDCSTSPSLRQHDSNGRAPIQMTAQQISLPSASMRERTASNTVIRSSTHTSSSSHDLCVASSTVSHDPNVTARSVSHGSHMTSSAADTDNSSANTSVLHHWNGPHPPSNGSNREASSREDTGVYLRSRTARSSHGQPSDVTSTVRLLSNQFSEPIPTTSSSSSSRITSNSTGQSSSGNVTPPVQTRRVSVIIDDARHMGGVTIHPRPNHHRLSTVEPTQDTQELRERLDRSTSFIASRSRERDRSRERTATGQRNDRPNRDRPRRDHHWGDATRRPVPNFPRTHESIVPRLPPTPPTVNIIPHLPPSPPNRDIFTSRGSFGGVSGIPMPRPSSRLLPPFTMETNPPSQYEPPPLLPPWLPRIGTESSSVSNSTSITGGVVSDSNSTSQISVPGSHSAQVPGIANPSSILFQSWIHTGRLGSPPTTSTADSIALPTTRSSETLSPEFQSWITTGIIEPERRPRPSFVVPGPHHAPSTQRRSRRSSNVEVIVVDDSSDDSDDDEEIILTGVNYNPSRQIARDEAIARHLQAEFDREIMSLSVTSGPSLGRHQGVFPSVRVPRPVPAGPSVPSQSGRRQTRNSSNNGSGPSGQSSDNRPPGPFPLNVVRDSDDEDEQDGGTQFIRDNFDALGSRINSWTPTEARTFLRLAGGMSSRHPRTRAEFMTAVNNMHPAMLAGAIMLSPFRVGSSYEDLLELAETLGPARPQGLRPEVINNLPLREHNSRLEEDNGSPPGKCVVCMCEYENKEKIRTLPCVHEFHQQCIDQWLQDHTTCPMCRVDVLIQRTR